MFPLVLHMPKESAVDTTLRTKNKHGEAVVVPCPKGTQINLCAIALHFNRKLVPCRHCTGIHVRSTAKYWPNPAAFNPDRFLGDWNRDAFIPFSAGARSCIGRRYAMDPYYPGITNAHIAGKVRGDRVRHHARPPGDAL